MKKITIILTAILLASCGHVPDQDILARAVQSYQVTKEYYGDLLKTFENDKEFALKATSEEFIEQAKLLGQEYYPSSFWGLFGQYYSDSCPLHKAVAKISEDVNVLEKHLRNLEKRAMVARPVYGKMFDLRKSLLEIRKLIRSKSEFVEEAKFIEKTDIAKSQLYEQQKQTRLLEKSLEKPKVSTNIEENNYNINIIN